MSEECIVRVRAFLNDLRELCGRYQVHVDEGVVLSDDVDREGIRRFDHLFATRILARCTDDTGRVVRAPRRSPSF